MFFVLPGRDGAPVETLRYEAMRAAAQDYELLKLVERTLPADLAQATIAKAMAKVLHPNAMLGFVEPDTARAEALYSLDPQDYQIARRALIHALSRPS
jgi:hypothetical protein